MLQAADLTIRLNPADDVVIARVEIPSGTTLVKESNARVAAAVPAGHKIAVRAVVKGQPVRLMRFCRSLDKTREGAKTLNEIDLARVVQNRQVHFLQRFQRDVEIRHLFGGVAEHTRRAGVRVLHVEDGVIL